MNFASALSSQVALLNLKLPLVFSVNVYRFDALCLRIPVAAFVTTFKLYVSFIK